jgi:probable phosphoglycerate mutase
MGRLLLVRHGESQANALRRFTESDRNPLSPLGREQAARTATLLRARFAPVRIVSSPFARARETAEIIAAEFALPIEIDPALREQSLGELHGQPFDAALATPGYATLVRWEWRPPAGETLIEVQKRAVPALLAIARASVGVDVVVASHSGTIQSCWAHVERSWEGVPPVPNCSIVLLEHDGDEFAEPELLVASSLPTGA